MSTVSPFSYATSSFSQIYFLEGDKRRETGHGRQETVDRRRETEHGDGRWETGDRR